MAADNPNLGIDGLRDYHSISWPRPRENWLWPEYLGGEYPTGRRGPASAASGWECPGCHRCFSPATGACTYCGPKALRDRIPAEEPVRLGGSHRTCPAPLEGGMCGCEEADHER